MSDDTPKILIIDDNPTNLQVAADHLEQYAYVVLSARDGETGVERARYAQPDLILLDIDMPGIDGFEVCRRLKSHPATADIPVIYMTASSAVDDKLRAFELGGVDYVTKPLDAAELLARVRTHLTLVAQRRRLEGEAARLEQEVTLAMGDGSRLLEMVRLQAEQVRALTRQWLDDRSRRDRDLALMLRTELSDRLELVRGELKQARHLVGEGAAAENLDRALALLEPALRRSQEVEGRLTAEDPNTKNPLLCLSTREHEVFGLLVEGKSNKEIAATLELAATTVSTYRVRILEKLGVTDVPSLVKLALGFVP